MGLSGLGAGAKPDVGASAAVEAKARIADVLQGAHMVFITAGMGGGTGTGAAPIVAKIAKEMGILTVGVVSKPFDFEGARRSRIAEEGAIELEKHVDSLIVVLNEKLFQVMGEDAEMDKAFSTADDVLHNAVNCGGNGWRALAPQSAALMKSLCALPARVPTWWAISITSTPIACRFWVSVK